MKDIHFTFQTGKYWFTLLILKFNLGEVKRGSPYLDVLLDIGGGWARTPSPIYDTRKRFFFRFGLLNFKVKEGDYKSSIFYQAR